MVGRVENSDNHVHEKHSTGGTTLNREVQKVTRIQETKVSVERDVDSDKEMPREQAEKMIGNMNDFLLSANSQLKFQYHDELNEYYVTIINSDTDEVIREIPSKKLMDIHAAMREFVGLLIDRKV